MTHPTTKASEDLTCIDRQHAPRRSLLRRKCSQRSIPSYWRDATIPNPGASSSVIHPSDLNGPKTRANPAATDGNTDVQFRPANSSPNTRIRA
jgi:hypothetical protein